MPVTAVVLLLAAQGATAQATDRQTCRFDEAPGMALTIETQPSPLILATWEGPAEENPMMPDADRGNLSISLKPDPGSLLRSGIHRRFGRIEISEISARVALSQWPRSKVTGAIVSIDGVALPAVIPVTHRMDPPAVYRHLGPGGKPVTGPARLSRSVSLYATSEMLTGPLAKWAAGKKAQLQLIGAAREHIATLSFPLAGFYTAYATAVKREWRCPAPRAAPPPPAPAPAPAPTAPAPKP